MHNYPIIYLLESSICLAVFYLFFRWLLRKEAFLTINRIFVLLAVGLSLLIPFIEIPLTIEPQVYTGLVLPDRVISKAQESTTLSSRQLIGWIYLLPCIGLLGRLLFQIGRLYCFSRLHQSSNMPAYRLVLTEGKLPTFSFFSLLFWNNRQPLSAEQQEQILHHELAHIRQWHSLDIVFIEVVKAFFWFHPAIYLFKKEVQQLHEYLADATVVEQHNRQAYIQLILSQVFDCSTVSLTNPFSHFQTKNRIMMLHKFNQARPAFWKIALSLPIIVLLVLVYSCNTNNAEELAPSQVKENVSKKASPMGDEVFMVVEEMPQPKDGLEGLFQYIGENIKYPAHARTNQVEGKVFVQFVVKKDGSIGDVQILKGIDSGCDAEAARVIKAMPAWTPGKQNGQAVDVAMTLPIAFKLGE